MSSEAIDVTEGDRLTFLHYYEDTDYPGHVGPRTSKWMATVSKPGIVALDCIARTVAEVYGTKVEHLTDVRHKIEFPGGHVGISSEYIQVTAVFEYLPQHIKELYTAPSGVC
ncbi:hypothetical protein W97_02728 [Coniosporium apollinis CBS 100218]|uniref:Uncharacterized protein n=1 Tax=Coniosporium apollinis (strain CBS 100218) TaxID=1168221 RepID=R7YNK4_CONA1|nr:uncharacterized protein W97_02728 [Coniosporium apollinis CBS 100218]EON63500.1 hypothetical protein W97_02728 [Coniosporium apollinis CBS 100218]